MRFNFKQILNVKNTITIALFVATIISCTNPKQAATENAEAIEFIYQPTYQYSKPILATE